MQPLISTHDDAGDVRAFQAYYCPACDEVRWCLPGDPQCWLAIYVAGHELIQVWAER